ncbi:B3 domain-containing protein REM17 isoform X2 [Hevea brasiliensis]|nr:B3 domain-containing protein REM17 isoform X2 [Hevea brasiliensis]
MVFDVMVFEPSACLREYPSFPTEEFDIKEEKIEFQEQFAKKSSPEKSNRKKHARTTLEGKATSSVHEERYFVVKLTSYSAGRSRLHIPIKFARTHNLCNRRCKMILMNQKGRSWPAMLWCKKSDGQIYIGRGWTSFRAANNLKAGDSLIFEHIEKQKIPTLKLCGLQTNTEAKEELIYHDVQAGSSSIKHHHFSVTKKSSYIEKSQRKIPEEELAKECGTRKPKKKKQAMTNFEVKASSSALEHPYFVAKVTSRSACRSRLYIPAKFARLNNLSNRCCKMILMDLKGRSWPAKLWNKKPDGPAYIHGWQAFRDANDLRPGDSFIFELIEKEKKPVLKMCRLKVNPKANRCQDGEASSSSVRLPHFYVTMKASHIQNSRLQIPIHFARRNDLIGKCSEMILTNERGSSWLVSLGTDNNGKVYIGCGWNEFAKANDLREGNIFMLELVKGGKNPAMKFYGVNQGTTWNQMSYKDSAQRIKFENCEDVKPII